MPIEYPNEDYADVLAKMACVVKDQRHRETELRETHTKQANAWLGTAIGAGVGGAGTYLTQLLLSKYYKTRDPDIKDALLGMLLGGATGGAVGHLAAGTTPKEDRVIDPEDGTTHAENIEEYKSTLGAPAKLNPVTMTLAGAGVGTGAGAAYGMGSHFFDSKKDDSIVAGRIAEARRKADQPKVLLPDGRSVGVPIPSDSEIRASLPKERRLRTMSRTFRGGLLGTLLGLGTSAATNMGASALNAAFPDTN